MTIRIVRVFEASLEFAALTREAATDADADAPLPTHVEADEEVAVFAALVDAAYVGLGALRIGPSGARICNLYVRPSFRRRGVGRALAGALAEEGLHAAERVALSAASEVAGRFWEAVGFTRTGAAAFETARA